jgi:hypothetical protein
MTGARKPFNRTTLEEAFESLGEKAILAGKVVDISVYGGSALVLTTNYRVSTHDVDAVFEKDRAFVNRAAQEIAAEFGWPADWLNDGAKGFLSNRDDQLDAKALFRTYPSETRPGLRVFVASAAYLFAMKCLAMRMGGIEQNEDVEDIRQLGRILGVTDAAGALSIVSRYYPAGRLPPKTRLGIEEIFGGEK